MGNEPGLRAGARAEGPGTGSGPAPGVPAPVIPDYGGGCIDGVVGAIFCRGSAQSWPWLPPSVVEAAQVVLLVLDGLGWEQLRARPDLAPFLSSMDGGPITSVAPTTTATALTSITTGLPPAGHEIVGYRVNVDDSVLNVLRWRTSEGDARVSIPPGLFQTHSVFAGGSGPTPVVTRAEFAQSGFTVAHLPGVRLLGWRMPSSLVGHVRTLLGHGEPFVYAYYDGIDKVAHEYGFGPFYDAELRTADRLVADVAATLPPGGALVVIADHGQVEVGDATQAIDPEILAEVAMVSGEGRFRWLHALPGRVEPLKAAAVAAYGTQAWVRTVDELEDEGWFGGKLTDAGRGRLGDVALVPFEAVAFADPADTGESRLRCRHGSLTSAEVWVPLLAFAAE